MGAVPDTQIGLDAAGIIKRVGTKVTLVQPGDRVATLQPGAYRTLLRTDESLVAKLPANMSMEAGASLPTVYVTAYQALYMAARLEPGETVLIHSATGGELIQSCSSSLLFSWTGLCSLYSSSPITWSGEHYDPNPRSVLTSL